MIIQNRNILLIALGVGLILLVPLVAMQYSDDVNWTLFDFAIAGTLLFGTGLAFELVARKMELLAYRAAVGVALATALLLIWINIAVGIIGSEDNPANRMYLWVIAILMIGALSVRFRPHGMAFVLYATALAQATVTLLALFAEPHPEVLEVSLLNGFFVALWVGSAVLFQRADATLNQHID